MRVLCILVTAAIVGAAVGPAGAQERVWFYSPESLTEVGLANGGRDWTRLQRVGLPIHSIAAPPFFVAGGRYLVWASRIPSRSGYTNNSVLVRFDTRTRALSYLPSITLSGEVSLAVDRRSGALVVLDQWTIYVMNVADQASVIALPFFSEPSEQRTLAVARGRVFIGRSVPEAEVPRQATVILSLATGRHLGTIEGVWLVQAAPDESRIYVSRRTTYGYTPAATYDVQVWDADSLTRMASATIGPATGPLTVLDDLVLAFSEAGVRGYDGRSLRGVFEAPINFGNRGFQLVHASPRAPIVTRGVDCSNDFGCHSWINVYEPRGLIKVRELRSTTFDEPCACTLMVMLAPPEAPTGVRANVAGTSVTVEWDPPPDIGEYEVVAGSAPGLNDIGTFPNGAASFATFEGVPSGTYYVRVRAINELGATESAEIRVIVR